MKQYLAALGGAVLALLLGAGVAMAGEPTDGSETAMPPMPTGDVADWKGILAGDTSITEVNGNTSGDSFAGNLNGTGQTNGQSQIGAGGNAVSGPATAVGGSAVAFGGNADGGDVSQDQAAANLNKTGQTAQSASVARQKLPTTIVAGAAGGDSTVNRTNANTSGDALALNGNVTRQANDQAQAGAGGNAVSGPATAVGTNDAKAWRCLPVEKHLDASDIKVEKDDPCHDLGKGRIGHPKLAASGDASGGDVDQSQKAVNGNKTHQDAEAKSVASQKQPVVVHAPAWIASDGDSTFSQWNTNTAGDAASVNGNQTSQANGQGQLGFGGNAVSGPATAAGDGSGPAGAFGGDADGGDVTQGQHAANLNGTGQNAQAKSVASQKLPVVVYAPVRIASEGDSSFTMVNTNTAGDAFAQNLNSTDQANGQAQAAAGGNAVSGPATAGDGGYTFAGSGDASGGNVAQSQDAANVNWTDQNAEASSVAYQSGSVVIYAPVRISSPGNDTFVLTNTNTAGNAFAGNGNATGQANHQAQIGYGGHAVSGPATAVGSWKGFAFGGTATGGDVTQGQSAFNGNHTFQHANALSKAIQRFALFLAYGPGFGRLAA